MWTNRIKFIIWMWIGFGAIGCASRFNTFSKRSLRGVQGDLDLSRGKSAGLPLPEKVEKEPDQIYIKKVSPKISPVDMRKKTGSLYEPTTENDLFSTLVLPSIGDFVNIEVAKLDPETERSLSNTEIVDSNENASEPNKSDAAKVGSNKSESASAAGSPSALDTIGAPEELLKKLPSLDTKEDRLAIVRDIKMQVIHRYPNGDLEAVFSRKSDDGEAVNHSELTLTARIPYKALLDGAALTTKELQDVELLDQAGKKVTKKSSSAWNDEYTLRVSGYNESRTTYAVKLEDKRKKLEEVRAKLKENIVGFGKARSQAAKERDNLVNKSKEDMETIRKLRETISAQEEELKLLKPQPEAGSPEGEPASDKANANAKVAKTKPTPKGAN